MKKFILAIGFILISFSAQADDKGGIAQCTSKNVGELSCQAGKSCECKFFRASAMAGTPDRFSWDCGINRPNCGSQDVNVTTTPAYNGPSSVGYGVSNSTTNLTNSPTSTQQQSPSTTLNQQQQSPTTNNTTTSTQNPTQTQTQSGTQTNSQNSTQTNH